MKQINKILLLILFICSSASFGKNESSWFKKGIAFSTLYKNQLINCSYFAAGNANVKALDISFHYYNPINYEKTTTISVPFFKLLKGLNIPTADYEVTKKELKRILPNSLFVNANELVFFIKKKIFKLTLKENNASEITLLHTSSPIIYSLYTYNNNIYSINEKGIHQILNNTSSKVLKWQHKTWLPSGFNVNINKKNQLGVLTLKGTNKEKTIYKSIVFNLNNKRILKRYDQKNAIAVINKNSLLTYANEASTNNIKIENFENPSIFSKITSTKVDFSNILKTVVCEDRFIAIETAHKTIIIDILSGEVKKTIDFTADDTTKGYNKNLLTGYRNKKLYFATKSISLFSLFETAIDQEAPKLFVNNLTKNAENKTTNSFTTIQGRFIDNSAIKSITINQENVTFNSENGSFSFTTNLKKGLNKFVISGTDLLNNTQKVNYTITREEIITIASRGNDTKEANIDRKITEFNYKALLISNEKYTNDISELYFPTQDATKLITVLQNKYSFEKNNIIHLKDATRSDIINTLDSLATKITSKDNLLIFYAGHGVFDETLKKGYWIPVDASFQKNNWVSNSDIRDYISAIKSQHTLLISDACFSGSIFEYNHRSLNPKGQVITDKLINKKSRKAMTSGLNKTVPDKSIFIKYLLKTLNDNQKPYLRAGELYNDIREAVMANTDNNPQFEVIKNTNHEGGEFIFLKKE